MGGSSECNEVEMSIHAVSIIHKNRSAIKKIFYFLFFLLTMPYDEDIDKDKQGNLYIAR